MQNSDLLELVHRIEGYDGTKGFEIISAEKKSDCWALIIKVREENEMNGFIICEALNGWDRLDYFSVLTISKQEQTYRVVTKRVLDEDNQKEGE